MKVLFTETELRRLLGQEEGQFLEFKSLWDLEGDAVKTLDRRTVRNWIAEYAAAFANADGGTIVLGVDDDGKPSGHGYPDEVIREPQEVINERKQAYRRVGYEQRLRSEATIGDLDMDLAREFLTRIPHAERPVEEVLERYGLLISKAGGTAVTNAALLLFGKAPFSRWHPRAGVRFFRAEGTRREHGTRRNVVQLARLEPPLASLISSAHAKASEHIRRSEKLHNLFFREMPEYPLFAWQEAMVNAIAHRDYNDQGREIEVWFFDDRMEVLSPGDLIAPVTIDHLQKRLRRHASRNPLIVRVLADVGIMREEGEGIPRIYEEMEESFLRAPEFSLVDTTFCVTLRNQPIFEGPSAEWVQIVDQFYLNSRQKRVLLAHPNGFSNEDYRKINDVDRDHAYREIQEMVTLGILVSSVAAGRGATYAPSPGLLQTRAWLEGRIAKLQEHFKMHDRLDNMVYRRIFGLTRHAAKRELKRLTEESFLTLRGAGRGAHYVIGPALERGFKK